MPEIFTLSEPIRVGGEEVTELTLRKPTVDMLQGTKIKVAGDGGMEIDADTVIKVFARLADIPPSAARKISGEDYVRMVEIYANFFGQSPRTGET